MFMDQSKGTFINYVDRILKIFDQPPSGLPSLTSSLHKLMEVSLRFVQLSRLSTQYMDTPKAPPSRGFSYIEVWITGVQFNILFAILEYSCILTVKRMKICNKSISNMDYIIKIVDIIALIVSFTIFSIFNVIYWILL